MNIKLATIILSAAVLCSCEKIPLDLQEKNVGRTWNTADTNRRYIIDLVAPVSIYDLAPILLPGQTEYCIPNLSEFYAYVWSLQYGPAIRCPYNSYAMKRARVTFIDGAAIDCGPTVTDRSGTIGQGGLALRDLSCTSSDGPFLTDIVLIYYGYTGGQSMATYPLYSCAYGSIGYPTSYGEIRLLKGGITYILHSTATTFSYTSQQGNMLTKTIKQIEFVP